jgi:hypothetical protein
VKNTNTRVSPVVYVLRFKSDVMKSSDFFWHLAEGTAGVSAGSRWQRHDSLCVWQRLVSLSRHADSMRAN